MGAGVSLCPATPVESLRDLLPELDLVLIMSVDPGFGGQAFIETAVARIAAVRQMAANDGLDIHISVLTAPKAASGWEAIELGRHGIVLQKAGRSATFLPQVAPEQGWDLETTLNRLSQKAGLPADAWREGASFLLFEAEVFGEHDDAQQHEPESGPRDETE